MASYPLTPSSIDLLDLIGEGSYGAVYKAKNKRTGEIWAVKQINVDEDYDELQNILKEVKFMFSLRHPNIISYHGSYVDDIYLNLAMEYVAGGSIRQIFHLEPREAASHLQSTSFISSTDNQPYWKCKFCTDADISPVNASAIPTFSSKVTCVNYRAHVEKYAANNTEPTIDEPHLAVILDQVLKGLAYLHSSNVIHRDIKCDNILMTFAGTVKLTDFGVSGSMSNFQTKRMTSIGSPYWMAPEVIRAETAQSPSADIWSLGITVYECLNGRPPRSELPDINVCKLILSSPPPDPTTNSSFKYSRKLLDFFKICLIKDPVARASVKTCIDSPFLQAHSRDPKVLAELLKSRFAYLCSQSWGPPVPLHCSSHSAAPAANSHRPGSSIANSLSTPNLFAEVSAHTQPDSFGGPPNLSRNPSSISSQVQPPDGVTAGPSRASRSSSVLSDHIVHLNVKPITHRFSIGSQSSLPLSDPSALSRTASTNAKFENAKFEQRQSSINCMLEQRKLHGSSTSLHQSSFTTSSTAYINHTINNPTNNTISHSTNNTINNATSIGKLPPQSLPLASSIIPNPLIQPVFSPTSSHAALPNSSMTYSTGSLIHAPQQPRLPNGGLSKRPSYKHINYNGGVSSAAFDSNSKIRSSMAHSGAEETLELTLGISDFEPSQIETSTPKNTCVGNTAPFMAAQSKSKSSSRESLENSSQKSVSSHSQGGFSVPSSSAAPLFSFEGAQDLKTGCGTNSSLSAYNSSTNPPHDPASTLRQALIDGLQRESLDESMRINALNAPSSSPSRSEISALTPSELILMGLERLGQSDPLWSRLASVIYNQHTPPTPSAVPSSFAPTKVLLEEVTPSSDNCNDCAVCACRTSEPQDLSASQTADLHFDETAELSKYFFERWRGTAKEFIIK